MRAGVVFAARGFAHHQGCIRHQVPSRLHVLNESVAMEEKNREKKAKERRTTDLHPSLSAGIYPHVAYCSAFNPGAWEKGDGKTILKERPHYRKHHESSGGYTSNVEPGWSEGKERRTEYVCSGWVVVYLE